MPMIASVKVIGQYLHSKILGMQPWGEGVEAQDGRQSPLSEPSAEETEPEEKAIG